MAVENNILDNYRSVSYNFTFAAITPAQLSDPKQEWRSRPLDFIIATTKGKHDNQFNAAAAGDKSALVTTFNKNSPGAFDLWIDNVEIDTIMAPTEQTGPALGTKVTFEVFEPYSVNGLIEALHVSAQAAGWSGYINATFIIKIEFMGYKDTGKDDTPEIINADKIIPIRLTGAEIEVTEQGTRYKCKGIPVNEMAMSNPNKLTAPRQMTGDNVGEVLKDLFKGLNEGIRDRAKKEKSNSKIYDSYEIFFPDFPEDGSAITETDANKIREAEINKILTSNNVYQFQDLADKEKNPNGSDPDNKYDPKHSLVQFPANADVIDIITAVIRDSKYLKDILETIKEKAKEGDGMINYFQIITRSIPTEFDSTNNKQCYKYQYLVVPYKVHSSQLPDQQFNKFDSKQMDKIVKRSYDYLYGGKNVDIINFKLNFNNLYFQAANPNQGNTPSSETANSAAPSNNVKITKPDKQISPDGDNTVNEVSQIQVSNDASGNVNRAGPASDDPYWQLAFNAHQSILESVSLLTGEIELLGDPYYLCTSGMGNYLPTTKDIAETSGGEANFTSTPVVVRFNFRNPIDIGENGFLNFGKPAPFSGLYRVIKCHSVFRDGLFKQSLKVIRYQGQISEDEATKTKLAPALISEVDPTDSYVQDSAPANTLSAGTRLNGLNLAKLTGKGNPVSGLPGNLNQLIASGSYFPGISDFLNNESKGGGAAEVVQAANGLLGNALGVLNGGGVGSLVSKATAALGSNPLSSLSNLANGAVSGIGSLVSNPSTLLSQASGVIGQGVNLINQSSGIGLQVGKTLEGLNPLTAGIRLDSSAVGNIINQFKGSGSAVDNAKNMIANVTSVNGLNLSLDQRSSVVTDALSKGISPDLALRNASTLGIKLSNVSQLTPGAMLGQLGIDPSQLSGLAGDGSDILKQLKSISDSVPENVDINVAKKLGISLGNLDQITLKNLPALPSLNVKAPEVEKSLTDALDDAPGDPAVLAKFGLTQAMGDFKSNIPGALSNLNNLKSGLGISLPSANSLIANAQSGFGSSITAQLGSLTSGSPLDKLNIPKIGLG